MKGLADSAVARPRHDPGLGAAEDRRSIGLYAVTKLSVVADRWYIDRIVWIEAR